MPRTQRWSMEVIAFSAQSTLAPDTFTIRAYLVNSAAMNCAKSAGVFGAGSAPSATNCARMFGVLRILVTSAFHLATIGAGVPAGANRPYHVEISKPGKPASDIVGNSGARLDRFAVVTASARNLPPLTCAIALARLSNMNWVSPARSACVAGAAPLYGIWTAAVPVWTVHS